MERKNVNSNKEYQVVELCDVKSKYATNEFTGEEMYQNEIEDGILFYHKIEAFKNLFKKKEVLLEESKQLFGEELIQEAEEEIKVVNTEDLTEELIIKMELREEREKEKAKRRQREEKKKLDIKLPYYLTIYDIHIFRLMKFIFFILSFSLAFISYQRSVNRGALSLGEIQLINQEIKKAVFFNTIYKEVLKHPSAFLNRDTNMLLNSRQETSAYFNLILNNLLMKNTLSNKTKALSNNTLDIYNGYFQRKNSYYETLGSMKITFKKSNIFKSDTIASTNPYLNISWSDSFLLFRPFFPKDENTSPSKHEVISLSLNCIILNILDPIY